MLSDAGVPGEMPRMTRKTIVVSINASWNIVNFRKGLIDALRDRGDRVVALAPEDAFSDRLRQWGIEFVPIRMNQQGISPIEDLGLLARYRRSLGAIGADIFLGYTVKPNIYGSLAAHSLGIPVINNISGLGTAFLRRGWLTALVTQLYRTALRRSKTIFFQNHEDRRLFLDKHIVRDDQARLLPGSGIDLERFRAANGLRKDAGPFAFLFVGRLLWDKGVREYVEAARLVRRERPDVSFRILGFVDAPNRTAVPEAELRAWVDEGLVEYLGASDDVRPHLAAADCIVLPSYREGLPRVLLEGAAFAKPLIATDVPGCRQVVEDGVNGLLCEARDPQSLAEAMLRLVALPAERRAEMGREGRRKAEAEFDQRIVIERYLQAIDAALERRTA
jgi:glycosyltransferase involved in cell wall biosynthesis